MAGQGTPDKDKSVRTLGRHWVPSLGWRYDLEDDTLPNASEYEGPQEALEKYRAVVGAGSGDAIVKGAKNAYTSRNGHMFSFLDPTGLLALRLSDELGEQFQSEFESGPVMQYGSVMRGYVSIPPDLLSDTDALVAWFDRSYEWIGTLPPKETKGKK